MMVGVGSMNEVKIEAVRICFEKFFGGVDIVPVSVEVPPQPIGFEETLRGAVIRALKALDGADADLGVGIEAGLIRIPHTITGYADQHICAIIDADERGYAGLQHDARVPRDCCEEDIEWAGEGG